MELTSTRKRVLMAVGAIAFVALTIAVVALAVGSRLQISRIENRSLAEGAIQVQVAEASGTTSTGSDHNVFVVGSGLVFETDRSYAVVLYTSDDCSSGPLTVAPWLPENTQLRTVRGNAPPGSELSGYGSVGVTMGDPPELIDCAAL